MDSPYTLDTDIDRAVETASTQTKPDGSRLKFKFPSRRPADIVCVGAISIAGCLRLFGVRLQSLASHVDTKADPQNYTRFFNLSYRFKFTKLLTLQPRVI
ncbi:MAG: hypothetical protein EAZ90_21345 [Oscillatoriales cyanobacterium]|nr:MAG: hypothetical protein EAZ94_20770 [Oscillatoriales cyanobacterium]TAE18862.1 MAG: hypothetical protein EAZ93_28375 [Oscillatoriales cyanobacterium]TAE40083.1 MAG: hypothetical protein EAZ90_21345 [Oscillatoriales cyanobacterium]TAE47123.1 MAG: hypothetical protein EAZ88_25745 [Oscillatoriales cyanobacterium]TAE62894.1 MAG: hypothetical protein EAZ86_30165 [Oscillatoriales cyanobacterium]